MLPQSLLSSSSCSNWLIPYCKCSLPLHNTPSLPLPVFSKQQQQNRLPMLLLSTPVLSSLVHVVSAGGKGLMLSFVAFTSSIRIRSAIVTRAAAALPLHRYSLRDHLAPAAHGVFSGSRRHSSSSLWWVAATPADAAFAVDGSRRRGGWAV